MERAIRLHLADEPFVIDAPESDEAESYATRQMRRRARRAEAKAARRRGPARAFEVAKVQPETEPELPLTDSEPVEAELQPESVDAEPVRETGVEPAEREVVQETVAEVAAPEPVEETAADPVESAPPVIAQVTEPSQLAAAMSPEAAPLPRNRALAKPRKGFLARMLGALAPRRQVKQLERCPVDPVTEQLVVLRTEIALIQSRLDRMISAATR